MSGNKRRMLRFSWIGVVGAGLLLLGGQPSFQQPVEANGHSAAMAITVDGQVALHSFMALGDGHLKKIADSFHLLAQTDEVRSGDWKRIRGRLGEVARVTVPAVLWYAKANGDYSSLQNVRAGNLSDRPYFPSVLRGETVIGHLVVSRSTSRNTAIVAVPVRGRDNAVVGVLGASVHLDSLGTIIREEMGGLEGDLRFFSIDATPMGAIHTDPAMIFTDPLQVGDERMRQAFTEMLSRTEGVVTYPFQGKERTMLYHKSLVTNWWYAIGVVAGEAAPATP